jgi:hypothetical protein
MTRLFSCLAAMLAFSVPAAAEPALVVTTDPHSEPESVTVAPDGSLILGSASKPVIYRAAKGATHVSSTPVRRARSLSSACWRTRPPKRSGPAMPDPGGAQQQEASFHLAAAQGKDPIRPPRLF